VNPGKSKRVSCIFGFCFKDDDVSIALLLSSLKYQGIKQQMPVKVVLTMMKLVLLSLLLWCQGGVDSLQSRAKARKTSEIAKQAAAFCVAGCLFWGQPVAAASDVVYGNLEKAIIDASDATYPVLKSLTTETITPFGNKVANILTKKMAAEKLSTVVDCAANALLSIPDDNLDKFASTVKESYQGVSSVSCDAVPLPLDAFGMVTSSEAFAKLDSEKLSQVAKKLSATTRAIPFSEKGICLPASPEGLEQVWIGQTELIISIPRAVKQDFATSGAAAVKSIPNADLLRVLPDVKKVLGGVDKKAANKFQETGKTLDQVLKQDRRFQAFQAK
jgi:hypothetical protein